MINSSPSHSPSPIEAAAIRIVAIKANEATIAKLREDVAIVRSSPEVQVEHADLYGVVVRHLIRIIEEANVVLST